MRIADGLEMLEITTTLANGPGTINPTLFWDEDTAVLVDTGLPGLLPQFHAAMEKAGMPFDRLDKIVITHHDMDHLGGLAGMLKEATQKIAVLSHVEEKPYIQTERPPLRLVQIEAQLGSLPEERRAQMQTLYESYKAGYPKLRADVDKTLADGEELPWCGGIEVIHTPGHTPGHICLYLKQSKTLIAGDALNVEGGVLVPAPDFTTLDKDAAAGSLKKLARYDIETVICYHGGLYRDHANRRIGKLADE